MKQNIYSKSWSHFGRLEPFLNRIWSVAVTISSRRSELLRYRLPRTLMIPWSKRHATIFAISVCTQLRRRRFLNCNWRSQWNDTKLFDTSAICVEVTDTSSTEKLSPSRSMFAQEFLVHLQEKLETSQVKPSQATAASAAIWGRYNSSWLPACNDISLEVNEDLSGVEHQVKVTQALDL